MSTFVPAGPRPYITCKQVLDFIMAYLDGELSREELYDFERHLAVCPSCTNYLGSYRQTVSLSQALGQGGESPAETIVPADLVHAIEHAMQQQSEGGTGTDRRSAGH